MDRIQPEWIENEWVVVADNDAIRFAALSRTLEEIGFPTERLVHAKNSATAIAALKEKKASICFLDESIGTLASRGIHAQLTHKFGELGFFFFAITEGGNSDFVQFAAEARIDGIIFRPFYDDEFRRRVAEVFAMKWPNRVVQPVDGGTDFFLKAKSDAEFFEKALEKERRLGQRDPLTLDGKVTSIFGLKKVAHPAVTPGKASFTKIRLAFKAVARNGETLKKPFSIHVLELDENRATIEAAGEEWETGDHVTIEADITNGDESYMMRIEAIVQGDAGPGLMTVTFDQGNRTRFEAAMKMVAKRFKDLKDFFKYAKGA